MFTMRYIENYELREWVKENLRKAIFHKAHALAVQTGCEILVKLQDDIPVSDSDATKNCYYATDRLGKSYTKRGVHKEPGEIAISGDTGLPIVSMVDRGIQSRGSSVGTSPGKSDEDDEVTTEPDTNDVLSKTNDDELTALKESGANTTSTETNSTTPDSDQENPVPMQLSLTCTTETSDSLIERLTATDDATTTINQQQNIKQEANKDVDVTPIKIEVIDDDDDDDTGSLQMTSEHIDMVDEMVDSSSLGQSYIVETPLQTNYPVPMSPKPYQCGMCQKAFRSIQVLQKHTQTFHQRAQQTVTARSRGRGYVSGSMGKRSQHQFQVPSSAADQQSSGPSTSKPRQPATASLHTPFWINSFKFPGFPKSVSAELAAGKVLSFRNESIILDFIFEAVRPYTVYPSHAEYSALTNMLLQKFPSIRDEINFTKLYWVRKIQHKFQNVRKRDPTIRQMLAVRSRKRKEEPSPRGSRGAKRSTPHYPPKNGLEYFLPSRPRSQNDASVKRNQEWLRVEVLKDKPDLREVSEVMALTFSDRRRDAVDKRLSIQDVQMKHPWLLIEHEFLAEFKRIHGVKDMKELLEEGLQKYAACILEIFTSSRTNQKTDMDLKLDCSEISNESQRKSASINAAIYVLPVLLREDAKDMFTFKDEQNFNSVFISTNWKSPLESTEYTVLAEGTPICTTDDFMTAVASYFAAFYVFNLPYVEKLEKTMVFVQTFILDIKDGSTLCKPILTLASRLNRAIKKKH